MTPSDENCCHPVTMDPDHRLFQQGPSPLRHARTALQTTGGTAQGHLTWRLNNSTRVKGQEMWQKWLCLSCCNLPRLFNPLQSLMNSTSWQNRASKVSLVILLSDWQLWLHMARIHDLGICFPEVMTSSAALPEISASRYATYNSASAPKTLRRVSTVLAGWKVAVVYWGL